MIDNILSVKSRTEWREWLVNNFEEEKEIWLVYPKKSSGRGRILYNDVVEEALCFGWIDSIIKTLDENNLIQRFTPRNPKSSYSQANIERLRWLSDKGLIHQNILKSITEIINKEFIIPKDIISIIKKDKTTWEHFQKLPDSYCRIRIAYIASARKRPEEFKKRLNNFIEKTRENKLIKGYGGIEKYY